MMNIKNWAWPKLTPTNLNLTSGVFLTFVPDVFFLKRRKARLGRCPSLCEPASQCKGTLESRPHQHIFLNLNLTNYNWFYWTCPKVTCCGDEIKVGGNFDWNKKLKIDYESWKLVDYLKILQIKNCWFMQSQNNHLVWTLTTQSLI